MSEEARVALVTGASRGIGKAIALRAARDGANVVVAAKTKEPHPKLPGTIYSAAEEIEAAGGAALTLPQLQDRALVFVATNHSVGSRSMAATAATSSARSTTRSLAATTARTRWSTSSRSALTTSRASLLFFLFLHVLAFFPL